MRESDVEHPIQGVKHASPLINFLFFHIVLGFIVDYLHCCLEGVAKQFTKYFLSSVSQNQMKRLNKQMEKITAPQQVSRLCRSFEYVTTGKPGNGEFCSLLQCSYFFYFFNKNTIRSLDIICRKILHTFER